MSSFFVSASDPEARVVHEEVEPAEALAVGLEHANDVALLDHVRRHVKDVDARVAQLGRRVFQLVRPARGDRDAVAVLPERSRDRKPDPAGAAGDQRRLVSQPFSFPRA
jgi:hypothetical protein